MGFIIIPILQMNKRRHQEVEQCAQGHRAGKPQRQGLHSETLWHESPRDRSLAMLPYYTPGKMCPGCGSGFQNTLVQSFLSWQHVDFLELFSPIVQFLVFKFQIGFSHQESQDHFSMPHLYFCFQGRIVKKKVSSLENETFRLCLWTRPGQAITQIILCSAWS